MANVQLLHGDCLEIMRTMEPNSVDSICTDPPYMLNFMGKAFDKAKDNPAANVDVWAEALRVAKPGAHLLAFGGDRTHHRMMVAIEDAGWEIRTCLYWCFGSGFPKSHRVSQSPMFCQCAEVVRNDESKGRETRTDARTHTEAAFSDGVDCPSDDGYSMNTLVSSQDGYQQDRDSHGEQLHQGQEGDQAFSLQQEYVQAHSHSAARGGDLDRVALHSPFQAQCNDHLSSQDYSRPSLSPGDASGDTQANKAALENISTQTDNGFLADHKSHKAFQSSAYVPPASNYATGFPCCQKCGKPIADGWGTALKPAVEIIVMARKPLIGTVAANVQAWGCGGLNIDQCRISHDEPEKRTDRTSDKFSGRYNGGENGHYRNGDSLASASPQGRWPANLCLDPEAAALLDQMSGERPNGGSVRKQQKSTNGYEGGWGDRIGYFPHDTGGASRFFARFAHDEDDAPCDVVEATPLRFRYQSKASKRDRDEGLEGMASKGNTFANGTRRRCVEHDSPVVSGANTYSCGCAITYDEPRESVSSRNGHPTVKPTALMQWLVRLVTPPGGTILDPFMGSGSTGKAAMLEGFNFIGVELSEEYLEIARRRIEHAQGQAQQQAHMPVPPKASEATPQLSLPLAAD